MKPLVLVLVMVVVSAAIAEERNKLIIVAMSGLRHDYVDKENLQTLKSFMTEGVRVKNLNLNSITNSFPSLWTVATGLKPEEHGILDDNMYDPELSTPFHAGIDLTNKNWFRSEPLWISAEKAGIKTAVSGWPGADLTYDSHQARHHPFVHRELMDDTSKRVNDLAEWMLDCDLGLILFPEPDNEAHQNGADSPQVNEALRRNDILLGKLITALQANRIMDKTNIIVIGDHGMADHHSDQVVYLTDLDIRLQHISWVTSSIFTTGLMEPHEQYMEMVLNNLKNATKYKPIKAYSKNSQVLGPIPDEFGIRKNRRCAPILIVADKGYRIELIRPHTDITYDSKTIGMHGYAPSDPSMKAAMLAKGPDFKNKLETTDFQAMDLHPLVCSLLKMNCPGSDGVLAEGQKIVKTSLQDFRGPKVDYFKPVTRRGQVGSGATVIPSVMLSLLAFATAFI